MTDAVLSLLGLAQKAGKIASGEFATEKAVKGMRAFLVFLSEDASDNTRKRVTNMCSYYEVPVVVYGKMADLGRAIGKGDRSMLAILDQGFANAAEKKIKDRSDREV